MQQRVWLHLTFDPSLKTCRALLLAPRRSQYNAERVHCARRWDTEIGFWNLFRHVAYICYVFVSLELHPHLAVDA